MPRTPEVEETHSCEPCNNFAHVRACMGQSITVKPKEADGERWVWSQDREEDGENEDARRYPGETVALLRDCCLELRQLRLQGRHHSATCPSRLCALSSFGLIPIQYTHE